MSRKVLFGIFIISLYFLGGCSSRVNDDEVGMVLHQDPAFKRVIEDKKRSEEQISLLTRELNEKRKNINSKIDILKKELRGEETRLGSDIGRLQHKFDPLIDVIKEEAKDLRGEIKEHEVTLLDIERTMKDLNTLLSKEGALSISKEEANRWLQKIDSLQSEKINIKKELEKLKLRLKVFETKLKILR